jgi:hypothetical protein
MGKRRGRHDSDRKDWKWMDMGKWEGVGVLA